MIIAPYGVKNPPKRVPIATIALIVANILVFFATSHQFLVIRREVVEGYALVWGTSPPITIFTSMFLHGDIFHLLGNMLFLWVFGPAVEDRVGAGYLGLYFLAGFAGDVAQAGLGAVGALGQSVPLIGASGCIMGVLGAYWYMYSWSPVRMFYWIGWIWRGTFEIAAIWVIGAYFVLDLASGLAGRMAGAAGGVANFAHVGGALAGVVLVWAVGVRRDSGAVSKVRATEAVVGDDSLLSCDQMWTLVQHSPEDKELLVRYALKAVNEGEPIHAGQALESDVRTIVMQCPEVAVHYLFSFQKPPDLFSPTDLLYLAKWCENGNRVHQALPLYKLVEENHPNATEAEMALYRQADILWRWQHDRNGALEKLEALFSRFPSSHLTLDAQDLQDEITVERDLNAA